MPVANDELLIRSRRPRRWLYFVGIAMVALGVLLLAGVGSFYGLGIYSYTQLDELNASYDGPLTLPDSSTVHGALLPDGSFQPVQAVITDLEAYLGPNTTIIPVESLNFPPPAPTVVAQLSADDVTTTILEPVGELVSYLEPELAEARIETIVQDTSALIASYASLYPGSQLHPKYWGQPQWAGTDPYTASVDSRPSGFRPVGQVDLANLANGSPATRMRIPAIGLDAITEGLEIVDLGDSKAYETPKNVVGQIPEFANPGEVGNGWFFGHLESPVRGEGSVFRRLPDLPEFLQNGDPVYISITTADGEFLYQVISSEVIHQDELRLYDSDDSIITLVTCANRPHYNYRQLVTAKLIGVRT